MKIVSLKAENVKRIKAVEIHPDGSMVVIGGRNGQGKTSILDSIAMALGGAAAACERPLRDGAEHGEIVVDLGDLVVRRTFDAAGGTKLLVKGKDGNARTSPQTLLDQLAGRLSFDPLAFARTEPKKQLATLQALVGLDFTDMDARRKTLFDERTTVGRDGTAVKARRDAMPHHPDAPAQEVSATALVEQAEAARANNQKRQALSAAIGAQVAAAAEHRRLAACYETGSLASPAITAAVQALASNQTSRRSYAAEIAQLERQLAELRPRHDALVQEERGLQVAVDEARSLAVTQANEAAAAASKEMARLSEELAGTREIPVEPILAQVKDLEVINRKVRENQNHRDTLKVIETARARWDELTAAINVIDQDKKAALAAAKFPVPGLSFDENGVLFNGVPFAQASSAEQLRVSVAMGMSLNPKLRVVLIRDGSLLDEDSMRMIAEMAAENDAQVWCERVGHGEEVSVLIEDGSVMATEQIGGAA